MNKFKAHYATLDGDEIVITITEVNSHRAVFAAGRKLREIVSDSGEWEFSFIETVKEG